MTRDCGVMWRGKNRWGRRGRGWVLRGDGRELESGLVWAILWWWSRDVRWRSVGIVERTTCGPRLAIDACVRIEKVWRISIGSSGVVCCGC